MAGFDKKAKELWCFFEHSMDLKHSLLIGTKSASMGIYIES